MPEPLADLFIAGTPVPQGSKSAMVRDGKAVMFEANKETGKWRTKVKRAAAAARDERGGTPITGPLSMTVLFLFEPTFSNPDRHWRATKPDLDKLERALYDGLVSGRLIADDALIVRHLTAKRYVEDGEEAGIRVVVESLADHERLASGRRQRARMRRPTPAQEGSDS